MSQDDVDLLIVIVTVLAIAIVLEGVRRSERRQR